MRVLYGEAGAVCLNLADQLCLAGQDKQKILLAEDVGHFSTIRYVMSDTGLAGAVERPSKAWRGISRKGIS